MLKSDIHQENTVLNMVSESVDIYLVLFDELTQGGVLSIILQLSFDLIQEWIRNNPKASICTPEGVNQFRNIANFQDYHGLPEFRQVISKPLMAEELSLKSDNILKLTYVCV